MQTSYKEEHSGTFRGMHCRLRNIAMRDYQESVTTGQTHRQTADKVIPMCRYASQAIQQSGGLHLFTFSK